MACNWLIKISTHCPNVVRIGYNAKILSRFKVYGVMHDPIGIAFDAKELLNSDQLQNFYLKFIILHQSIS